MQNNDSNKNVRFWKEKGSYILLSLCLIAVGVSGWFFLSGAVEESEEVQPVLSIPVEVETPETAPAPTPEETPSQPTAEVPEVPETVMPVSGNVLENYAMDRLTYNPTTRDWRVHSGVDLAAEVGTPVKAAKTGTVKEVYEDDYYGVTVVMEHDGGYTTCYSNLAAETLVTAGDRLAAGDTMGVVGQTALLESAQPSHLHFAVYENGQPIDPAGFLY